MRRSSTSAHDFDRTFHRFGPPTQPTTLQYFMPPTKQFQEVPTDQHFEFRGRRFKKVAPCMAADEDRNGTIFQAEVEVLPDPLPQVQVASKTPKSTK